MTKELVEVVQAEVTQADRDAAAKLYIEMGGANNRVTKYLVGALDDNMIVQAMAAHRLSTEVAIVAWLREQSAQAETEGRSIALWEAADAIEQEKHRG